MSGDKLYLTWSDFGRDMAVMAAKALEVPEMYGAPILAVGRGGMAPAAYLSHMLGDAAVHHIAIKGYSGMEFAGVSVEGISPFHAIKVPPMMWVVDDLIDSGATFRYLNDWLSNLAAIHHGRGVTTNYQFIAVYDKRRPKQQLPPYRYALDLPDKWIVFPYERDE